MNNEGGDVNVEVAYGNDEERQGNDDHYKANDEKDKRILNGDMGMVKMETWE